MDKYENFNITEFISTLDISDQELFVLVTHIASMNTVAYKEGFTKALELSTGLSKDDERLIKLVKECGSIDVPAMVTTMLKIITDIKEGAKNDAGER